MKKHLKTILIVLFMLVVMGPVTYSNTLQKKERKGHHFSRGMDSGA